MSTNWRDKRNGLRLTKQLEYLTGLELRWCASCDMVLPVEGFYKSSYSCKDCSDAKHKEWVERNPEKLAAHKIVAKAKELGLLELGLCEKCGTDRNIHAHHEDYSKPLSVVWLCSSCHGKLHYRRAHDRWGVRGYIKKSGSMIKRIFSTLK